MKRFALVLFPALAACAPAASSGPGEKAAVGAAGAPAALVPAGYGTLRQDEITVSLRSGPLLLKVTPLAEDVIRLAAPDTYDRLHGLAERRREEADRAITGGGPQLFLVSFFSYEPDTRFEPESLQLVHQGRLLRARAIQPVTPGWGMQRLQQQETHSAIYVFEPGLDLELPLLVRYGFAESDEWSRIVPRLQIERTRVQARAP